ncbi:hypothetical protein [Pedobacter sp. KLB.chiD]|uniref:hypothetical protein n=1 Tax=Pedobacter sp. KLB.chiD TaxID=3387402 RepID=UPI00399A7953
MDKIYELKGHHIKVVLEPKLIRVYSNAQLWAYLEGNAAIRLKRFELLVNTIKADYQHHFGNALAISNASLIVEILVHVYCDYLGLHFNRMIPVKWIQQIVKKLLKRAEVVDCGEKAVDTNRWFWDLLAGGQLILISILPRKLNAKCIKHH